MFGYRISFSEGAFKHRSKFIYILIKKAILIRLQCFHHYILPDVAFIIEPLCVLRLIFIFLIQNFDGAREKADLAAVVLQEVGLGRHTGKIRLLYLFDYPLKNPVTQDFTTFAGIKFCRTELLPESAFAGKNFCRQTKLAKKIEKKTIKYNI